MNLDTIEHNINSYKEAIRTRLAWLRSGEVFGITEERRTDLVSELDSLRQSFVSRYGYHPKF